MFVLSILLVEFFSCVMLVFFIKLLEFIFIKDFCMEDMFWVDMFVNFILVMLLVLLLLKLLKEVFCLEVDICID